MLDSLESSPGGMLYENAGGGAEAPMSKVSGCAWGSLL